MSDTILCCDWGTTNLRLCRVEIEGERVVDVTSGAAGVKTVYDAWKGSGGDRLEHYVDALRPHLQALGLRRTDRAIVISGMASSSIGITELPYAEVPFRLDGSDLEYRVMALPLVEMPLLLLSGVRTSDDVMRGEETEMIGLWRSAKPRSSSLFILPGTHSKHIRVEDGAVASFRTYMTGELFDLLATRSVLAESVEAAPFDAPAFERGVRGARDLPGGLFTVRTNRLFEQLDARENYWYLSGLVVGSELAEFAETSSGSVCICGMSGLASIYRAALDALGGVDRTVVVDEEVMQRSAVDGQLVAYRRVLGSEG